MDFRKQYSFNEAEKTESGLIERTTRFLKMTEGLRVTEADIMLSAASDCNEHRSRANGQRIVRLLLSCCEKILKGKRHLE